MSDREAVEPEGEQQKREAEREHRTPGHDQRPEELVVVALLVVDRQEPGDRLVESEHREALSERDER